MKWRSIPPDRRNHAMRLISSLVRQVREESERMARDDCRAGAELFEQTAKDLGAAIAELGDRPNGN